ncbi:MAG TPA: hypothetical protein VFB96_15085 [Pirellulaceae bacterium]|nr:hypothetical protein [Pirellulaceae bacterium]
MADASVPSLIFLGLLVLFALLPLALQLRRQANVDSPWFWAYWFGIFGLIALLLASPKFQARQAHIEREFQGRTRATQNLQGAEPDVELSAPGRTEITLWPLFAGLSAITVVSWLVYYRTRQRPEPPAAEHPVEPTKATPA